MIDLVPDGLHVLSSFERTGLTAYPGALHWVNAVIAKQFSEGLFVVHC